MSENHKKLTYITTKNLKLQELTKMY